MPGGPTRCRAHRGTRGSRSHLLRWGARRSRGVRRGHRNARRHGNVEGRADLRVAVQASLALSHESSIGPGVRPESRPTARASAPNRGQAAGKSGGAASLARPRADPSDERRLQRTSLHDLGSLRTEAFLRFPPVCGAPAFRRAANIHAAPIHAATSVHPAPGVGPAAAVRRSVPCRRSALRASSPVDAATEAFWTTSALAQSLFFSATAKARSGGEACRRGRCSDHT